MKWVTSSLHNSAKETDTYRNDSVITATAKSAQKSKQHNQHVNHRICGNASFRHGEQHRVSSRTGEKRECSSATAIHGWTVQSATKVQNRRPVPLWNSYANQKKRPRCQTIVCISVGCSNFSFGESTKGTLLRRSMTFAASSLEGCRLPDTFPAGKKAHTEDKR